MQIDADARIPLMVGRLLSDTFSSYLANIATYFSIAFIPLALWNYALEKLAPPLANIDVISPEPFSMVGSIAVTVIIVTLAGLLIFSLLSAVLTLTAYDATLGRQPRVLANLGRSLRNLLPIAGLGLLYYIGSMIGLILLILPGLYIAARYWVLIPTIIVEEAGWSGLNRSAWLTRGYRWPIIGGFLVTFLLLILFSAALEMLQVFAAETGMNILLILPVGAISDSVTTGVLAVFTAKLYARLREIKEGLGIEDLFEVFE